MACQGCGEALSSSDAMVPCPSCGTHNDPDQLSCRGCGEGFGRPLHLRSEHGRRLRLSIDLRANQHWATRMLGEDGRLWDRGWQMAFVKREERWLVVPNPRAVNDSILNGERIESEAELRLGDIVGVGRASKAILRTPLTVIPGSSSK